MAREFVNDESWNQCFGCSPHNDRGMGMTFRENDDGTVESRFEVPTHLVGPPGTVHGGIQAVLLDEVMGTTARIHAPTETTVTVTAEMQLKYRRPVPIAEPLLIRGRLLRAEGRDFFITAEILDGDDEVLTAAEARFRALGELPRPR